MKRKCTDLQFLLLIWLFWLLALPETFGQTQYCTTNLYSTGCSANDRIDRFDFGTINNLTTTCGTNGYSDFTAITANVNRNNNYTLRVQANAASAQGFGVWIDFNQDLDFDDAGEFVYATPTTGTQLYTKQIPIPGSAVLGQTRLRVRSVKNALMVAGSSCSQFAFGETEDYTLNVLPNTQYCTDLYNIGCTTQTMISAVKLNTINTNDLFCNSGSGFVNRTSMSTTVQMGVTYPLEVTVAYNAGAAAVWVDYNNDLDFDDIGEFIIGDAGSVGGPAEIIGTITIPQNITPGNKRMRVRSSSSLSGFQASDACRFEDNGETEDYTLNVVGQTQYCSVGLYQFACTLGSSDHNITSVILGTINNSSSCTPGGFADYSHLSTSLQRGSANPITIGLGRANLAIGVWIDFNHDLQFNNTDEFVYQSAVQTGIILNGNIAIPVNAPLGSTRMRIRTFQPNLIPQANQACFQASSGETEDYTVTIMPPPGPTDVGVSEIISPKSSCGLGTTETVGIVVKNYGTTSQSNFPVGFAVNGVIGGTQIINRTIPAGDTIHLNFISKANLSALSGFILKAWTSLPTDAQLLNDTTRVTVTNFGNGISVIPHTENFDTFLPLMANNEVLAGVFQNGWSNATNDNIEWRVSSASTRQLANVGPTFDHTSGSGLYVNVIYTIPGGATASMESPCLNFTNVNNPTLEFWYHMFNIGSGSLAVDVNDGGTWNLNVFNLNGSQQGLRADPWLKATVSLLPYAGKVIRLRFRAQNGTTGAIALDDIGLINPPFPVHNIGVALLSSPQTGCSLKAAENVCLQVTNHGNQPETNFPVTYQLNNLAPVTQLFSGTPLAAGQTVSFCFTTKANLSTAGTYQLKIYSALATDTSRANDTLQAVITNTLPNLNFTFAATAAQTYQFTAQNTGTGNLAWDFGDGNTSMLPIPMHQYSKAGTYTVKLTGMSANGCTGEVQQTISVVSGVKELAENVFRIYPNPAFDKITIELTGQGQAQQISVVSVLGIILKEIDLPSGIRKTEINVGDLPVGSYFIRVTTEKGNFIRPVILSR
ncbi:GEVED domain-containing protein [Adhaeribacter terreus]|uniref:GEVED domain-containing protein n=1 Tax=Adhaeribacter terreus TaxID=529703 RepID=A0ABW0E5T8_9BACT